MSAFIPPTALALSHAHSSTLPHSRITSSFHGLSLCPQARLPTRAVTLQMQLDLTDEDAGPSMDEEPASPPAIEETKLFVGNLAWGTTDSSLGEAFSRYGTVVDARVVTDRFTGRSRGFGFIEYDAADSAAEALEAMNGFELDGRNVRVDRANRRPQRQRRPSNDYY